MKYFTIMIIGLCYQMSFGQFVQMGQDIDGLQEGEQSGYSVAANSNATIVAVGAPFYDGVVNSIGIVRVYEYNGSSWSQIGQAILGTDTEDVLGARVALNDDGTILAVSVQGSSTLGGTYDGAVYVYKFNGTQWIQQGQVLVAEGQNDVFGSNIQLNSSGNRIIVGAEGAGARVFEFNGTSWIQLGSSLVANNIGNVVSIDPSGTVVAVGQDAVEGRVKVFEYNGTNWVQKGNDIVGVNSTDHLGASISLSNDGARVAIGIPGSGTGNTYSAVKVYSLASGVWNQVGSDIGNYIGDSDNGQSIQITPDGSIVGVVCGYCLPGVQESAGEFRIYIYSGSNWIEQGNPIQGEGVDDRMGKLAISDDGKRVVLGARFNSDVLNRGGHVRVFENLTLDLVENKSNAIVSIYPNPSSNGIINIFSNQEFSSIEILNLDGRRINKMNSTNQLNLNLKSGLYFINLLNDEEVFYQSKVLILD